MKSQYTILDMFAGAGGLTEGFIRNNFFPVSHIEMNPFAALTLETRVVYHLLCKNNRKNLYNEYFEGRMDRDELLQECAALEIGDTGIINKEISSSNENAIIHEVQDRLDRLGSDSIDIIIGGPPCQAYSLIGRGRDSEKMNNDPRNHLYLHYLRFIRKFRPELFVFENVPGLYTARNGEIFADFKKRIKKMGYSIESNIRVLNSRNFGVLQDRKRIIFIGWKDEHDLEYPVFENRENGYKVWNLLNDLPPLEPGAGTDAPQKYRAGRPSRYLRETGIRTDEKYVRNHTARNHNERDREIYRIAIKKWNQENRRIRYDELPNRLKTHRNRISFSDRFKVVSGDGFSHSVVAHISKDGHYFIHPDIRQARSLTVREVARLQSFPDNYIFEGSRTSQYSQIGNAVPPLMSEAIAVEATRMLNSIFR